MLDDDGDGKRKELEKPTRLFVWMKGGGLLLCCLAFFCFSSLLRVFLPTTTCYTGLLWVFFFWGGGVTVKFPLKFLRISRAELRGSRLNRFKWEALTLELIKSQPPLLLLHALFSCH